MCSITYPSVPNWSIHSPFPAGRRAHTNGLNVIAFRAYSPGVNLRDSRRDRTSALDALSRDVRYGLRRMVRDRGFTTAAVLILGLAIGANTAIFSVVNALLFRHQPF